MSTRFVRDGLVIYFANSTWYGPSGTDRHIAEALCRYASVLYVEPPVSALTVFRNPAYARSLAGAPPLERLGPRLARATVHVVPGMTRPVLHHLTAPIVRRATRAVVDRICGPARGRPGVAGIVSCREKSLWATLPARRTLFYATDDLPAGAELLGLPRSRLLRDEARTLRGADAIAVVSADLQRRYERSGHRATLVPNGCRPEAYEGVEGASLPEDVRLRGPIAGFVGHLNERIDFRLLEAVADAGISILIVGPVVPGLDASRLEALARRPNVHWAGGKPFAELPRYLRLIDVGLTPYADTPFNRASFPLKTLEYLAAGRGVVATPLPANEWLATDLIVEAGEPSTFVARVQEELAKPRTVELAERRRAFARGHSWDRRAEVLAELLELRSPALLPGEPPRR